MTIAGTTYWQFNTLSTAGMVNGGGFNFGATFALTDATTTAGTGNTAAPVITSVIYPFVAGDVGAWVFVKSGTSWTPGFYQITAVDGSGRATVNAAVGAAIQLGVTGRYDTVNTVAGVATVGTPTAGTIGVDYSQSTAAIATAANFAAAGASTTLTSASNPFRISMVGNYLHQTTTGTGAHGVVGWYWITTFNTAGSVTIDRTPNDGTGSAATTCNIGGALDLTGALCDSFFEAAVAGNTTWIKFGTYNLGSTIAIASASSSQNNPIFVIGYNAIRGDNPILYANMPTISMGANIITWSTGMMQSYINWTGTGTTMLLMGNQGSMNNCKVFNGSSSGSRIAASNLLDTGMFNCELVSLNGIAVGPSVASRVRLYGLYIHDSNVGTNPVGTQGAVIAFCLIHSCSSIGIQLTAPAAGINLIYNNTIYGRATPVGVGISVAAANGNNLFLNNIFYGLASGIQAVSLLNSNQQRFNNFFNNTVNFSNYPGDRTNMFLDPQFTNVTQLSGSTATISTTTLTQAGAFGSVVDGISIIRVTGGTGATVGNYLVISHTANSVTVNNSIGTSAVADKTWLLTLHTNFNIGPNLRGKAFPGAFRSSRSIGRLDVGAVQRAAGTYADALGFAGVS